MKNRYFKIWFFIALMGLTASKLSFAGKDDNWTIRILPNDVLVQIAQHLDINGVTKLLFVTGPSSISEIAQGASEINLKQTILTNLTNKIIPILNKNELSSLSKPEIEILLENNAFVRFYLLDQIHNQEIATLKVLIQEKLESGTFDKNKTYLAAFLSKYRMDLVANWGTDWSFHSFPRIGEYSAELGTPGKSASTFAFHSAFGAAYQDAFKAIQDAVEAAHQNWSTAQSVVAEVVMNEALDADWNPGGWSTPVDQVRSKFFDDFEESLKGALLTLKLSDPTEIGKKAYQLSELFALRWLTQNNTQSIKDVFNTAYASLDGSVSIVQVNNIFDQTINDPYYSDDELLKNPFIRDFKRFLKATEDLVNSKENQ
jgi:hypothetical protein